MAKMMDPKFKQSRRLGLNVCGHPKAMKRATRGTARSDKKLTEYGKQLLEKQRLRAYYGVLERQFVNLFKEAQRTPGQTGPNLVTFLERRLDSLCYRMGYASSIRQARQMVTHGHLTVNGKKVNIPSYQVSPGDIIKVKEKSVSSPKFKEIKEMQVGIPGWLSVDREKLEGKVLADPTREQIDTPVAEHLIVELYSK